MSRNAVTALCAVLIPLGISLAGGAALTLLAGPRDPGAAGKPLMQRWTGYKADDAKDYWQKVGGSNGTGLAVERRFLELDLVYPFVYGGALLCGLLVLWSHVGRPFPVAILVGLVALAVLADWTENLVQLHELARFAAAETKGAVEPGWIMLASIATMTKLAALVASACTAVVLAVALACGGRV